MMAMVMVITVILAPVVFEFSPSALVLSVCLLMAAPLTGWQQIKQLINNNRSSMKKIVGIILVLVILLFLSWYVPQFSVQQLYISGESGKEATEPIESTT